MSGIKLTKVAASVIPTPAANKITIFDNSDTGGIPSYKDETGTVTALRGGTGLPGIPGSEGDEGGDGPPGAKGSNGTTGATGATGATGGSAQLASRTTASAAIANTETVVVSASLAAGYLTAGMSLRLRGAGVGTTGLTPGNDTFRVRLGPTTLTGTIPTSVVAAANASVTAQPFNFEAIVTVRTTGAGGTIIGECMAEGDNVATGLFTLLQAMSATTATVAVDTTVTNLLELTFQSGTAGSSCTFHVATIEVMAPGAAGAAGGLVLVQQQTASASASLDFTTAISATYDDYIVRLVALTPATNAVNFHMRVSTDGGSTWQTTLYVGRTMYWYSGGVGLSGAVSTAAFLLQDTISNNANRGVTGGVELVGLGSSTQYKQVTHRGSHFNSGVSEVVGYSYEGEWQSTTAVNAVQFLFSAGNITSGVIRIYGIAKS